MFQSRRIDVISLGCSKNLVESERLLKQIEAKGYTAAFDSPDPKGEYVVVNTCGFISDAKEESINTILGLIAKKKRRQIGKLVVMGCLSQRYLEELKKELPEVDLWFGKFDWTGFIDHLPSLLEDRPSPKVWERKITTPPHSAYLKISEGCNRFCAFCAIPYITGRHTSRAIDEILEEVRSLVSQGVKEFNMIAQDLSSYGLDLYGENKLAELLEKMAETPGVEWIRLHYAYPAGFPYEVLPVMSKHQNICKYLDIALQHISDPVLDNMKRNISGRETIELLDRIRREVPGIRIRTTLMTGFPGEGDKEFEELKDFVISQRFDRMGAFAYCEEDDTFAARNLSDNIPEEIKQRRLDEIMELQQEISQQLNDDLVGTVQKVLIDKIENGVAFGRTQYDSPEVDPEVIIHDSILSPGEFVNVRITEAYPFELIGQIISDGYQV